MTRHIREEQLALYAFGDLDSQQSDIVAAHAECCGDCQRVLEEFRQTQSFVGAWAKDPEMEDLVRVRAGWAAKLQQPGIRYSGWAWWLAGAAAALALFLPTIHMGDRSSLRPKAEPVVARRVANEKAEAPTAVLAARVRRRRRSSGAGLRAVTLMAGAHQPPTMKMTTGDPNVVILWQMKEEGEDQ